LIETGSIDVEIMSEITVRICSPAEIVFSVLKSTQTKLKSLIAFIQIVINIGFNCNVTFPDVTERFFDKLGIFNFDIVPSLGLSCRFPSFDYVTRMIIVTIVPLFLALALGVAYCIFYYVDQIKKKKRSNLRTQTIVTLFLLLTFIVLTPTSSALLHYFKVYFHQ